MIAGIILMWIMIFTELRFFLDAFLGAALVYVIARKFQEFLTVKWHWNASLSAISIILGATVILAGISSSVISIVISRISSIDTAPLTKGYFTLQEKLQSFTDTQLIPADVSEKISGFLINLIPTLFNSTYIFVVNFFMMCFVLYFMLSEHKKFEQIVWENLPLSKEGLNMFKAETKNLIMSNVVGVPIMMVLQSIAAIAGYMIFGIKEPVFWGLITGFFSVFPIIGTALIWGPLGIAAITNADYFTGIGIILYGAIIVSNIDNLFRFMILKKMGNIHPLITVFGIIIGLGTMGVMGIIFGPVFLSLALLLVRIYKKEFMQTDDIGEPESEISS